MTIQERIDNYTKFVDDASRVACRESAGMSMHFEPLAAQLTRVLALLEAAEQVAEEGKVCDTYGHCVEPKFWDKMTKALADTKLHGDIP